jgi:hypothetical protein
MRSISLAWVLVVVAACGDESAPPGEITGTSVVHHLPDGVDDPVDMSAWSIHALVPDGSGFYTDFPGVGRVGGTFSIPDVPAGKYVLAINQLPTVASTRYYETFERTFDWDRTVVYRSDAVRPTADTNLIVDATGLSAWQDTDQLFLFSELAGDAVWVYGGLGVTNYPAAGATELVDLTINFRQNLFRPRLVDGNRGDVMYLTQVVTRPSPLGEYQTPSRAVQIPSFTMMEGVDTAVSVDLATLPDDDAVIIDWPFPAWEAQGTAVHPDAVFDGAVFALQAFPRWRDFGVTISGAPDLLLLRPPSGTTDLSGTLTYGDPYPAEWDRFGEYLLQFRVDYTVPGVPDPVTIYAYVSRFFDFAVPPSGPIDVAATPPRNITVDVSTETVSWDEPTVVPPDHSYWVAVYDLSDGFGATTLAYFFTDETSVTFPAGTLQGGRPTVVEVTVEGGSQGDYAGASALTDLISP